MTAVAALPALAPNADIRTISERVNVLIRWFNRPDLFVTSYAPDTGSSTAYVIAPSQDMKFYEVGQPYVFQATHANTIAAPTLAAQGLPAGVITRMNGSALSAGDIPVGFVPVICVDATTPKFALLYQPPGLAAQTYLGADVALNNTANFFSGPNTGSIGASGQVWEIAAKASVKDTAGAAGIVAQIFDGTNALDSGTVTTGGAQFEEVIPLGAIVTLSGATTFTLRAKDVSATSGALLTTGASGQANKATSITAKRLS